jgi:hypothetical protein
MMMYDSCEGNDSSSSGASDGGCGDVSASIDDGACGGDGCAGHGIGGVECSVMVTLWVAVLIGRLLMCWQLW